MGVADIPQDVAAAFFDAPIASVSQLSGGKLNLSLLVELEGGSAFVLQKISSDVDSVMYDNFAAVDEYLSKKGWEMPGIVRPTETSVVFTDSQGDRWCAFPRLENSPWNGDCGSIGSLLGQLHVDLASFDFDPAGTPLIRESDDRERELRAAVDKLPTQDAQECARQLLDAYAQTPPLAAAQQQVIHADCKIDNMLYRGGQAYTFIGWKTVMKGNPWLDIGDMMRSIAKRQHGMTGEVDHGQFEDFMRSYYSANQLGLDYNVFRTNALAAMRHITIVLAMRYAADYKDADAGYFAWDDSQYHTRSEHNSARAHQLYDIWQSTI